MEGGPWDLSTSLCLQTGQLLEATSLCGCPESIPSLS